jgi:hypothetical protein
MKKNLGFRGWFYFRTGWATYFAFLISAVNTLVVTYYLAIENIPVLKQIFPSLTIYAIVLITIGVPILVTAGYIHFKRSAAFKSEADIAIEANPHLRRILLNTEAIIETDMKLSQLMLKIINNEKLSENEIEEMKKLRLQISEHLKNRTINDPAFKFTDSQNNN